MHPPLRSSFGPFVLVILNSFQDLAVVFIPHSALRNPHLKHNYIKLGSQSQGAEAERFPWILVSRIPRTVKGGLGVVYLVFISNF
jgi:hypothetical protein